eukprot:13272450-Alexandrium_andersonii.AAC.1
MAQRRERQQHAWYGWPRRTRFPRRFYDSRTAGRQHTQALRATRSLHSPLADLRQSLMQRSRAQWYRP